MSNILEPDHFSRTHYKNEVMEHFIYFVRCYFIPDHNYNELSSIKEGYMKIENASMSKDLLKELSLLE